MNLPRQRLHNQQISTPLLTKPEDVVGWLGAVQSQDYPAAKWAVGLRTQGATDALIEQAFTDGTILRTHVMRPTWHFVLPADIRWLLALTAPRVKIAMRSRDRQLGLDDALFARSNDALAKALEGGKQITRPELASALAQAGIDVDDQGRFSHIIVRAELDAVVCSGPRQGKQFTYALLDERAPNARMLARDEALAEITSRYFTSHGPATLRDYVWWSGLATTDARTGISMISSQLTQENIDGQPYWFSTAIPEGNPNHRPPTAGPNIYLLPNFDEYTVGYADRSAVFDASNPRPTPKSWTSEAISSLLTQLSWMGRLWEPGSAP